MSVNLAKSAGAGLFSAGIATLLQDAARLASSFWLARLVTPEVFGVYGLCQAGLAVLGAVSTPSLLEAAYVERDPRNVKWASHAWVIWPTCLVMFVASACILGRLFLAGELEGDSWPVLLMPLVFLLDAPASMHNARLRTLHQWGPLRRCTVGGVYLGVLGALSCAAFGWGLMGLVISPLLLQLPSAFLGLVSDVPVLGPRPSSREVRRVVSFGVKRALGAGVSSVTVFVLAAAVADSYDASTYGFWKRADGFLALTVGRVGSLIVTSVYPVLTRIPVNSPEYRECASLLVGVVIASLLVFGAFALVGGQDLILVLYGAQWGGASAFLPALLVAVVGSQVVAVVIQVLVGGGILGVPIVISSTALAVIGGCCWAFRLVGPVSASWLYAGSVVLTVLFSLNRGAALRVLSLAPILGAFGRALFVVLVAVVVLLLIGVASPLRDVSPTVRLMALGSMYTIVVVVLGRLCFRPWLILARNSGLLHRRLASVLVPN